MDPKEFSASPAGRLVPTIDGAVAFVPHPLPPAIDLRSLLGLIESAARALGELTGVGRVLPNPHLLIRPMQRREAVASSRIEGTITLMSDLLLFEAGAKGKAPIEDAREVHNYIVALEHGIKRLPKLPLSLRLICEIHEKLLTGLSRDRSGGGEPGNFRKAQNWIGTTGQKISDARFVPPPPQMVMPCLGALEKYLHADNDNIPLLVRCALVHYQFETIHPFPDGNGRVGRLLVPLLLHARGTLEHPLLYLSPFFERYRDQYVAKLYEVSRSGAWIEWIEFFLNAVLQEAGSALGKVRALQDLQARYRDRARDEKLSGSAMRLIEFALAHPIFSVEDARKAMGQSTYRGSQVVIERLIKSGILSELLKIRPKRFLADEILQVLYETRPRNLDPKPLTTVPR